MRDQDSQDNPPKSDEEYALARRGASLLAPKLRSSALARRGLAALARGGLRAEGMPTLPEALRSSGFRTLSDDARERVLVLGGVENAGLELWTFSFKDWSWKPLNQGRFRPDATDGPAVALDAQRSRLIWFGGWPRDCATPVDDLYTLDLTSTGVTEWEHIEHTYPWPSARCDASLTIDQRNQRAVMYGGDGGWYECDGDRHTDHLNELWTLDLERLTWRRRETGDAADLPDVAKPSRATIDEPRDRVIVVGHDRAQSRPDWVFDLKTDNWKRHPTLRSPNASWQCTGVVPVIKRDWLIIHGPHTCEGRTAYTYWRWQLSCDELSRLEIRDESGRMECFVPVAGCYCRHRHALFLAGAQVEAHAEHADETGRLIRYGDAFLVYLD